MDDDYQQREDAKLSVGIIAMMITIPVAIGIGGWAGYRFLGGLFGFLTGFSTFIAIAWVLLTIWRLKNG